MTQTAAQWFITEKTRSLNLASFEMRDIPLPPLQDNQVLTRTRFISLDPYLARAMQTWVGETPAWACGAVHGRLISQVIASRSPAFKPGDTVLGVGAWRAENVFDASALEIVPADIDPPSLALGVLGRSGLTAYVGVELSGLKAGDTFMVSAATGPVGSVAGQLAKQRGARVIGMAGGQEKCRYATQELGFDVCIDHHGDNLTEAVAEAAPQGISVLFENVGASSLDAALPNMTLNSRIMLCGLAAHYRDNTPVVLDNFYQMLQHQVTMQAFVTARYPEMFSQGVETLKSGVASGALKHSEHITDGLENAAAAYLAMLEGNAIGKRLIRIGD